MHLIPLLQLRSRNPSSITNAVLQAALSDPISSCIFSFSKAFAADWQQRVLRLDTRQLQKQLQAAVGAAAAVAPALVGLSSSPVGGSDVKAAAVGDAAGHGTEPQAAAGSGGGVQLNSSRSSSMENGETYIAVASTAAAAGARAGGGPVEQGDAVGASDSGSSISMTPELLIRLIHFKWPVPEVSNCAALMMKHTVTKL